MSKTRQANPTFATSLRRRIIHLLNGRGVFTVGDVDRLSRLLDRDVGFVSALRDMKDRVLTAEGGKGCALHMHVKMTPEVAATRDGNRIGVFDYRANGSWTSPDSAGHGFVPAAFHLIRILRGQKREHLPPLGRHELFLAMIGASFLEVHFGGDVDGLLDGPNDPEELTEASLRPVKPLPGLDDIIASASMLPFDDDGTTEASV